MLWKYKINIRQFLIDDESQEAQRVAAVGIAAEVNAKLPSQIIIGECAKLLGNLKDAADIGEIAWFNASLGRLWDWLDANSVWVEL